MKLYSASIIKELCKKYKISPNKKLGQNFLIDKNILDKIINAAELKKEDVVLEVGPGFGVLTKELTERVKKVFAIDIDRKIAEILKENFKEYKNLEIINQDILKLNLEGLDLKEFKVVANLPYQITGAVIRKFLEHKVKPSMIVVMIQKEVAEKICAKPSNMSLLSNSVQFFGEPRIVAKVSKNSFYPVPKIDSAILQITPVERKDINEKDFFRVVRAGFSNPRKQLKNNLSKSLAIPVDKIERVLQKVGLDEKIRAEKLLVEDWIEITIVLQDFADEVDA